MKDWITIGDTVAYFPRYSGLRGKSPKNVRRATSEVRKHWSPAEFGERRRHASIWQKQLAFLAAFEAR